MSLVANINSSGNVLQITECLSDAAFISTTTAASATFYVLHTELRIL